MTLQWQKALGQLKKKLGDRVKCDETSLYRASFDNTRVSQLPSAVVQIRVADEVAEVLKLANRYKIPVTPRGSGTGTTAAARPEKGGWVIDLSALKSCKLDLESGVAEVGAGVVTADLQDKAEAQGWFFPPDPSSRKYCTIGGNLICNAGGMRGAKYGVTRDYVLALEGYLPTGEPVRWGLPLRKYVSGYNLRDLWLGSEGQLGIVTKAWLKLIPLPETRITGIAAFPTEKDALQAVRAILKARLVPSILEFMDEASILCCERFRGQPVFAEAPGQSLLLWELDGSAADVAVQEQRLREVFAPFKPLQRLAKSAEEAEQLWEIRRKCSPAMFQMGDTKINEDVVVPLKAQVPLLNFVRKLAKQSGLATPTFGHAADGNFHVHIMYNAGDKDQTARAAKAVQSLMEKVVELGGVITGEHGIGVAKSPFFKFQHTKVERAAMLAIKQALDPNNILNPGKMFREENLWRSPVEKVEMPWDHRHHGEFTPPVAN